MKKIIAKVLFFGLVVLGYGKSVFVNISVALAQQEPLMGTSAGLEPQGPQIFLLLVNYLFYILFWPITIVMLFFYGSYFYLRNKKEKNKKEKAKKRLRLASWLLITNLVIIALYLIARIILRWIDDSLAGDF